MLKSEKFGCLLFLFLFVCIFFLIFVFLFGFTETITIIFNLLTFLFTFLFPLIAFYLLSLFIIHFKDTPAPPVNIENLKKSDVEQLQKEAVEKREKELMDAYLKEKHEQELIVKNQKEQNEKNNPVKPVKTYTPTRIYEKSNREIAREKVKKDSTLEICRVCNGEGEYDCPHCSFGEVEVFEFGEFRWRKCKHCHGTQKLPCIPCNKRGYIRFK